MLYDTIYVRKNIIKDTIIRPFEGGGTYNWTVPAGIYSVDVFLVGGGRAGGRGLGSTSNYGFRGGSGGGGGYTAQFLDIPVIPGQIIPITIGAGGVSVGAAGGFSQFLNSNYRVEGGTGGSNSAPGGNGGSGGGGGSFVVGGSGGTAGANGMAGYNHSSGTATAGGIGQGAGYVLDFFNNRNAGGGGGSRNSSGSVSDYSNGSGTRGYPDTGGDRGGLGGGGYGGGGGGSCMSAAHGSGGDGTCLIRY